MKQLIINSTDFLKNETLEIRVDKFEDDIGFPSNISVNLEVTKVSDDKVHVNGAIEGYVNTECARCLSAYRHPIEIYMECDMDILGGEIDISDEIRQRIVLDLPVKPLCNTECLGICAKCGKHNTEHDKCSCEEKQSEEFNKERWKVLFNQKNNK